MRALLGILLIGALAACGGSRSDPTDAAGGDGNTRFVIPPVDNSNVTVAADPCTLVANITGGDTQSYQFAINSGVSGINAVVVINSTANACNDANANLLHVGEQQLVITLTDIPDQQMATNTYVFPAAASAPYEIASATYAEVSAACAYNPVNLVSGQVQLTSVQADSMSGTYSLQFDTGKVTGSFDTAPNCAALASTPAKAPTCR